MTKPAPIKAWAVVDADGKIEDGLGWLAVFADEDTAHPHCWSQGGERVIPVQIVPVEDREEK